MIERVCTACGVANEIESRRCRQCERELVEGQQPAPLARRQKTGLARRAPAALVRLRDQLPTSLRGAARPVALGLAAVAVEVGAALLQRRLESRPPSAALATRAEAPSGPARPPRLVVVGQRVTEEYEQGQLRRRVVEQFMGRAEP